MKYTNASMRMWSRLGPSGSLGAAAVELGKESEMALFLTADMTFASGLERFKNMFPDRLYNLGIAEQNLIGVASGLASEGYNPFAVTYATFLAARALDQVKMNLGYMKLPVKLIGLNGGLAAGILGPTHMALEDVAALRGIPNMTIVAPADMTELVKAVMAAGTFDGPMYIRFTGEMNQPQVYKDDYEFRIGKAVKLKEGNDLTLITSGAVTSNVMEAAEKLEAQGVSCSVLNMHTIKPIDTGALEASVDSKLIITIEEHNVYGGLGSAVAEYYAMRKNAPCVYRIGVNDMYPHAGNYRFLLRQCGLDPKGLEETFLSLYREVAL